MSYFAYFDGWTLECWVFVWQSPDGSRVQQCGFTAHGRTKRSAVAEMRHHHRQAHPDVRFGEVECDDNEQPAQDDLICDAVDAEA